MLKLPLFAAAAAAVACLAAVACIATLYLCYAATRPTPRPTAPEKASAVTAASPAKATPEPSSKVTAGEQPPAVSPNVKWVRMRLDEVQVSIANAAIDYVPCRSRTIITKSTDKHLVLRVQIENLSPTKTLVYSGWGGRDPASKNRPKLTDETGQEYREITYPFPVEINGQLTLENILPGNRVEDVMAFERPSDSVESLTLELPALNVKSQGTIRLELPVAAIRR